ncbi:MAG TPA: sulfotransferase [Stellaceae bacterium]|jgi:tetratricopeptide (TPR) repeat protein
MVETQIGQNLEAAAAAGADTAPGADSFAAASRAHQAGRLDEAERGYRAVLALDPRHAGSCEGLGRIASQTARYSVALDWLGKAIALAPRVASFHLNLGNALKELGRIEEAIAAYERAIALNPDFAEAYGNLGMLYISQGRRDDACRAYDTAIALDPRRGMFYRVRTFIAPLPPDSALLAQMEKLAETMATLPEPDQMELHYALGRAYGDGGAPERAFAHLVAGNALKRKRIAYDEAKTLGALARIETIFSREFFAARRDGGLAARLPVFIVGMPRSGSTLVEQILASHPAAAGAGEVQIMPHLLGQACAQAKAGFPQIMGGMTASDVLRLAEQYLALLRSVAPGAQRIVDKHLENFPALGLIRLMLPEAKIIHIRRDPMATCLSCFSHLFNGQHLPYTYELGELGRFYRGYARLMAHWRAVLPAETLLEVDYEALTGDFEPEARRIVAHCGLPWDERCRDFHKTERVVKTASALQVREPIYRSAVDKWRVYAACARPLIDALGDFQRGDFSAK